MGALWTGWAVCAGLLAFLWAQSLVSRSVSVLSEREAAMTFHLRNLALDFSALQKLPAVLVASLADDAGKGRLDRARIETVRRQARPYAEVFWVHQNGDPVLEGDPRPPPWIVPLARPRLTSDITVIRPEPPGMEAGRFDEAPPLGVPDLYLLFCARAPRDAMLVCAMNLDYVLGPWLREHVARFGFGPDASARAIGDPPPGMSAPPLPRAPSDTSLGAAWRGVRAASSWSWRVHSFFPDDPRPFDDIRIDLSNAQSLSEALDAHLLLLAGGALLMLLFGLAIRLAQRGLRRELEFAEARTRFTALVSHELRTPIAAIRMYMEILENGLVDAPGKIDEYHRIVSEEAGRLGKLVDDLLEMGRLERGAHAFKIEETDLNEVVREAAGAVGRLELAPDLPPARIDRTATRQVVANLVGNAIKYGGDPSAIEVRTRRASRGVAVEVCDRGPGIPPAQRKKVFEAYHRLSEAPRGVGLGLALVKGFVEGQGGTVEVSERPGGGSVFTVTLPSA
jgi:signal transduction histidine kinase